MGSVVRGLFINNKKAKDSIFESGYMVYNSLLLSSQYTLDYCEVDAEQRDIPLGYDFYLFNYHPVTMGWLATRPLIKLLGNVGTIILEVAPGDPFVFCSPKDFSFYCVLDPTIIPSQPNLFVFPRPLEPPPAVLPPLPGGVPVIGSFGFATRGKGFQHVVEAVNREFDEAVVRINIPYGDFVPDSEQYARYLGDVCRKAARPGITVKVTHDFMSKEELINWCASNSLNCFLYDRNMPGLAATTDQAIASGRPLSISDNDTFRHIIKYLDPYPQVSLKKSMEQSAPAVLQMQEDWSQKNFSRKFELIVRGYKAEPVTGKPPLVSLPLKTFIFSEWVEAKYYNYKRRIKRIKISRLFSFNDHKRAKKII